MPVHLITGDDPSLISAQITQTVATLAGENDTASVLEDLDLGADTIDEREHAANLVIASLATPAFLTPLRIVLVRNLQAPTAAELGSIAAMLPDIDPTVEAVFVSQGGRLAKAFTDAFKGVGGVEIATKVPDRQKDRSVWVEEQFSHAGLKYEPGAIAAVMSWIGNEPGRLMSVIDTLKSTFGVKAKLSAEDIAPFLGAAGSVAPWDLTDPIDNGDTRKALMMLARMLAGNAYAAMQIMAILRGHYEPMLQLDGAVVSNMDDVEYLTGKKGFRAEKIWSQQRRLGSEGVFRAIELLAEADIDLRGGKDWDDNLVLEVLVARLARLSPPAAKSQGRRVTSKR